MTQPRPLCAICFNRHRLAGSARCERCDTGRTPAPITQRNIAVPTSEEKQ